MSTLALCRKRHHNRPYSRCEWSEESRQVKRQKEYAIAGTEDGRKELATGGPTAAQKRGESQLKMAFGKMFNFLGEVALEAVSAAIAGVNRPHFSRHFSAS
jgi:hypothetical protein